MSTIAKSEPVPPAIVRNSRRNPDCRGARDRARQGTLFPHSSTIPWIIALHHDVVRHVLADVDVALRDVQRHVVSLGFHTPAPRPLQLVCSTQQALMRHTSLSELACCTEHATSTVCRHSVQESITLPITEFTGESVSMMGGPTFSGVIEPSHQASQLGRKLVIAQVRSTCQRLSRGGEVFHSRCRCGRHTLTG